MQGTRNGSRGRQRGGRKKGKAGRRSQLKAQVRARIPGCLSFDVELAENEVIRGRALVIRAAHVRLYRRFAADSQYRPLNGRAATDGPDLVSRPLYLPQLDLAFPISVIMSASTSVAVFPGC